MPHQSSEISEGLGIYSGLRTAGARKKGDRHPAVEPTGQRQRPYQAGSQSPFFLRCGPLKGKPL
jgi:hypothetical protein